MGIVLHLESFPFFLKQKNHFLIFAAFPELLINTIQKVDIDLRKTLYEGIVLSGGNTMIQAFPDRFLMEIKKLIPKDLKVNKAKLNYIYVYISTVA